MKFREHRGSLEDSLKTLREFNTKAELVAFMREELRKWSFEFADHQVVIEPYIPDARIGWPEQWLVAIEKYGVFGFLNGKLNGEPAPAPKNGRPKS